MDGRLDKVQALPFPSPGFLVAVEAACREESDNVAGFRLALRRRKAILGRTICLALLYPPTQLRCRERKANARGFCRWNRARRLLSALPMRCDSIRRAP